MRMTALYTHENKDADQLCGNCAPDQHLLFRFIDSTMSLFSKSEISSTSWFVPVLLGNPNK